MEEGNLNKFLTLSTLVFGAVFGTVQANADCHGKSDCCFDVCDPCHKHVASCDDCCNPDPCACDPCANQWYLGLNYVSSGIFERDPNTTYGFADSKYHWGVEGYVGYEFCSKWAFEAGFIYLGHTHLNNHGTDTAEIYHRYHKRKSYGLPLRFVYTQCLTCDLDLLAYVGAFFYLDKYSHRLAQYENVESRTPKCSENHSGVDLTWGFGAEYHWCEDFSIRLTWTRFEFNHAWNHKDTLNLGIVYRF